MNFKSYLESYGDQGVVTPRSKPISKEEALNYLQNQCSEAFQAFLVTGQGSLYRGLEFSGSEYLWIDPKSRIRPSKESKDYYQIIMERLPQWRDYPSRRTALICTTEIAHTQYYGQPHVVFPYDNAKFGICPDDDIWTSFKGIQDYGVDMISWDGFMQSLLNIFVGKRVKTDDPLLFYGLIRKIDETYARLGKEAFAEYIWKEIPELRHISGSASTFLQKYKGSMWQYFAEIFDPVTNNFKIANGINDLNSKIIFREGTPVGREVWTDSPAIIIEDEAAQNLLKI